MTAAHQLHATHPSVLALMISACVLLAAATAPDTAHAQSHTNSTTPPESTPGKTKKPIKVKQQKSSSEESRSERDRRLYRECKGLPNAGACKGYTQR